MDTGRSLHVADEAILRELHQARELLARVEARGNESETRELKEKLADAIQGLSERLADVTTGRRVEFPLTDDDSPEETPVGVRMIEQIVREPASADEHRAIHKASDDLRILCAVLGVPAVKTKYFQRVCREIPMLKRSLDTGAQGFANWVPTEFSATLHEQVRLRNRVAALHDRIPMPQDPYALPIEGTDAVAYIQPERGDANDFLNSAMMVTPSFDGGSTPGATALTLTSTKLMARVTMSEEATEESIIPVLGYLRDRKLPQAMSDAEETATVNGKKTGSHFDTDITSAADRRKAWNGYRQYAITATAAVTIANTQATISNIGVADLRQMRVAMGKYGTEVDRLAYITGPAGLMKLLSARDPISDSNPSPVLTLDKFGPAATILTGQMASLDGIPIIVSPHVREDLDNDGKYVGGSTADRTMVLLVNRDAFLYGDRRATRLRTKLYEETEQIGLLISQRMTFAHWFGTDPTVGYVYNIRK